MVDRMRTGDAADLAILVTATGLRARVALRTTRVTLLGLRLGRLEGLCFLGLDRRLLRLPTLNLRLLGICFQAKHA